MEDAMLRGRAVRRRRSSRCLVLMITHSISASAFTRLLDCPDPGSWTKSSPPNIEWKDNATCPAEINNYLPPSCLPDSTGGSRLSSDQLDFKCLCESTAFILSTAKGIYRNCGGCNSLHDMANYWELKCNDFPTSIALNKPEVKRIGSGGQTTIPCVDPPGDCSKDKITITVQDSTPTSSVDPRNSTNVKHDGGGSSLEPWQIGLVVSVAVVFSSGVMILLYCFNTGFRKRVNGCGSMFRPHLPTDDDSHSTSGVLMRHIAPPGSSHPHTVHEHLGEIGWSTAQEQDTSSSVSRRAAATTTLATATAQLDEYHVTNPSSALFTEPGMARQRPPTDSVRPNVSIHPANPLHHEPSPPHTNGTTHGTTALAPRGSQESVQSGHGNEPQHHLPDGVLETNSLTVQSVNDIRNKIQADRWLNGRAQFGHVRAFFRKFSAFSVDKDVRIGILDSDIDLSHPDFASYPNQVSAEFCRNFVTDETPEMICEKAKIYVARVFERDQNDTGAASRIPAAIEWAKENEVDIVVMAFSFAQDDGSMFEAISNAGKILFVAAVASERHNDDNPLGYPARFPNVIDVQPCNSQGSPWNPFYQDGEKLVILGEQVEAAFPNIDGVRRKCLSGSSQATSILAGVAGLVIQYSRILQSLSDDEERSPLWERLHTKDGMVAVLRGRMAGKRSSPSQIPQYYYIRPWLLFKSTAKVAEVTWHILDRLSEPW